jgi:hypothetical protein
MAAVLKCSFKSNNMFFVVWVSLLEFIEDLHLLKPCSIPIQDVSFDSANKRNTDVHRLLMSDNFDSHFPACIAGFTKQNSSTNNVCEHAFSERGEHMITAAIKLLTQDDLVIAFRVSGRV